MGPDLIKTLDQENLLFALICITQVMSSAKKSKNKREMPVLRALYIFPIELISNENRKFLLSYFFPLD